MRNLLNFFLKYNYWFLFIFLEVISFALLFRFNHYQGSTFFTTSNRMVGLVYEAANQVTGYFHLKDINDDLVQKNVELELQVDRLREKLMELTVDSSALEKLKKDVLLEYDNPDLVNDVLTDTINMTYNLV